MNTLVSLSTTAAWWIGGDFASKNGALMGIQAAKIEIFHYEK